MKESRFLPEKKVEHFVKSQVTLPELRFIHFHF